MTIDQLQKGTVLRIMPYGVMVRLDNGTVGLVHISEVADSFVEDLTQHCSQGASVVVRVLRQREDGRWEFSIKQAANQQPTDMAMDTDNFGAEQPMYDAASSDQPRLNSEQKAAKREVFDEKMRNFLGDSAENLEDARHHQAKGRGGKSKRR